MCRVILYQIVSFCDCPLFYFLYSVHVLCNSIGSIMIPVLLLLTTVKLLLLLLIISHHNTFGRLVSLLSLLCTIYIASSVIILTQTFSNSMTASHTVAAFKILCMSLMLIKLFG